MADVKELNINNTTYTIKDAVARSGLTSKQDTLVSGTNIKTINGNSLLGSGDITIQGGSASRNIGEIVTSTIPLTDAGLHLLDGSLLQYGSYQTFIDYIADIANMARPANTISNFATTPSNAFDGSLSTEGISGLSITIANNAYIGQSGLTKPVKTIRIYQGGNNVSYCSSYKLQYSNNGSTWIDIQTVTGVTQKWQTVAVNNYTPTGSTHSFRVLAVTFAGAQGSNNWRVFELELYPTTIASFTTEDDWQNTVTTYGGCGKYVYNSTNNTVRLPKIIGIVEGTNAVRTAGDLVQAGLPNITGTITGPSGTSATGAFGIVTATSALSGGGSVNIREGSMDFNASRSSAIYGNSSTVQPQTTKVLYYVVVATSTKTSIEVDIDEIATDLNGKADVDLTNINNNGTAKILHCTLPSATYDDLTVGASGTEYTAPADGWFFMVGGAISNSSCYATITNTTTYLSQQNQLWGTYGNQRLLLYANKGEKMRLEYGNTSIFTLRFYYANGSSWEAS